MSDVRAKEAAAEPAERHAGRARRSEQSGTASDDRAGGAWARVAVTVCALLVGLGLLLPAVSSRAATPRPGTTAQPDGTHTVTTVTAAAPACVSPLGKYGGTLSFQLGSVDPVVVTSTGSTTLRISGRYTNTSKFTISDLGYKFQRGDPLTSAAQIRDQAAHPCQQVSVINSGFTDLHGTLKARASAAFTATVPIVGAAATSLAIGTPGVYPIMININATMALPEGPARARVGELHLMLTVLSVPGSPDGEHLPGAPSRAGIPFNMLWPIVDRPHLGVGGVFTDDELASEIGPGGRLTELVDALTASQAGPQAITLVIDPMLLDELDRMTRGYWVAAKPGTPQPTLVPILNKSLPPTATAASAATGTTTTTETVTGTATSGGAGSSGTGSGTVGSGTEGSDTVGSNIPGAGSVGTGEAGAAGAGGTATGTTPTGGSRSSQPGGSAVTTPTPPAGSDPTTRSGTGTTSRSGAASSTAGSGTSSPAQQPASESGAVTQSGPAAPATGSTGSTGSTGATGPTTTPGSPPAPPPGTGPGPQPAGTVAGTGGAAATAFLDKLRTLALNYHVLVLPYADPDAVALVRAGMSIDLATAVYRGRAVAARVLGQPAGNLDEPTNLVTDIADPYGGVLDQATLAEYAKLGYHSVVLSANSVSDSSASVGAFPLALGGRRIPALVSGASLASDIGSFVYTGVPSDAATQVNLLAALLVTQHNGRGSAATTPMILTPGRDWAPNADGIRYITSLLAQLGATGVVSGTPLSAIAGGIGQDQKARTLRYPASAAAAELPQEYLTSLQAVDDRISVLQNALSASPGPEGADPAAILDPLQEALLGAVSASWRGSTDPDGPVLDTVTDTLDSLYAGVTIRRSSDSYTLASSNSPLLLTVQNTLPYQVTVGVSILGGNRVGLSTDDPGRIEIPGGPRTKQVKIDAQVSRSGTFTVYAQLRGPAGAPWGGAVPLIIASRAYGALTLVLMLVAGGVLVLMSAFRVHQRWRASRARRSGAST